MMTTTILLSFLHASAASLVSATTVGAAIFTINLDAVMDDSLTPSQGTPPWLTLTFTDLASNSVRADFTATDLTGSEFVSEWFFNLDPALEDDVRRTLRFLDGCSPDVYLPQCLPAMHYAARIAERRGLPWIFTLHSDDPVYWALAEQTGPRAGRGVWVAVSHEIGSLARDWFPKVDVRVIPYGVDIPPDHAAWKKQSFRVVYVGRLVGYQKRVSHVIDAMIRACRAEPRIECRVIGDGEERTNLESIVSTAGLAERISFAGRLEPAAVRRELADAHATVLMSDYEGLPVALLEAMAAGLVPVVRAIRSGIPELVVDGVTGCLCENDPDEVARELAHLASDCVRWESLSRRAAAHVHDGFSRSASLDAWVALIDEVAHDSSPRHPFTPHRRWSLPAPDPRLSSLDRRKPTKSTRMVRRLKGMFQKAVGAWWN